MTEADRTARDGVIAALVAYLTWGVLPAFLLLIVIVPAPELLAHRIIWSVPTGLFFIALARNWEALKAVMTWRRMGYLTVTAFLIGLNWLIYIWAVGQERVMEASLGYYMNPLVNVLIGSLFFAERLRIAQWVAVALATCGVAVMTVALGFVPYVSLILCFSFAFYSVIRKQVQIDSRAGFVVEAALLAPFALLWMGWFIGQPEGRIMGDGGWDIPLILLAGPITAVPLILFAVAAKRLRLSTIGMMQYLAPTVQFLIAVFLFQESFSQPHAIAFAFIWTALFVFTLDSVLGEAKARRLARAAASVR